MAGIAAFIFFGALAIIAASTFFPALAFFTIFSALTIFATLAVFTFTIRIVTFSHFYSPVKKITFKYTYTPYMYKCQDIFKRGKIAGNITIDNQGKYPTFAGYMSLDRVIIPSQMTYIKEAVMEAKDKLIHLNGSNTIWFHEKHYLLYLLRN